MVRLTRIERGEALRTESVEGLLTADIEIGRGIQILGEGLDFGLRLVTTSAIVEMEQCIEFGTVKLKTETGSVYLLEHLGAQEGAAA